MALSALHQKFQFVGEHIGWGATPLRSSGHKRPLRPARVCVSVLTLLRIRRRITSYAKEIAMLEDAVNCEAANSSHACNAMNQPN